MGDHRAVHAAAGEDRPPRWWPMREIVNAIFYVLRSGCASRLLPKDFPPMTTVYGWFLRFRRQGVFATINHHLVMQDRQRVGREASPMAAVIDSQSVKMTEAGGPRGYDAGKKIKGRKRHAMVDTDGRPLVIQAHSADIQDRDTMPTGSRTPPRSPSTSSRRSPISSASRSCP